MCPTKLGGVFRPKVSREKDEIIDSKGRTKSSVRRKGIVEFRVKF